MFILEFLFKIIAMGFILDENSYLRSGWNLLDFMIVITGIMALNGGSSIKIIRTLRLLRPLRTIKRVKGISDLVTALIDSIPKILNVMIFLMFIIFIFATFGLYLFNGMYEYRCRIGPKPVNGTWPLYENSTKLCNPDLPN